MHSLSDEDKTAAKGAMKGLTNTVITTLTSDPATIKETLINAANVDETARTVLEKSQSKSVAAAALLFALNEFRDNIYSGNSYESDITLIKKLAGDDPEMNAAINQLLPYAKSGVMSKDVLSSELKSLANDIVLAKMKGEDADVKEKALARFEALKGKARQKQLTANNEEAVIARAQVLLEEGDLEGAMAELESLKNSPSASATNNWISNATNLVNAGNSSDQLIQQLIQSSAQQSGFSAKSLIDLIMPTNHKPIYLSPNR